MLLLVDINCLKGKSICALFWDSKMGTLQLLVERCDAGYRGLLTVYHGSVSLKDLNLEVEDNAILLLLKLYIIAQ